jgi:hypothetical protein
MFDSTNEIKSTVKILKENETELKVKKEKFLHDIRDFFAVLLHQDHIQYKDSLLKEGYHNGKDFVIPKDVKEKWENELKISYDDLTDEYREKLEENYIIMAFSEIVKLFIND